MCKETHPNARRVYSTGSFKPQPQVAPQIAEQLSPAQRQLDHIMRCQKQGCTRCA